MTATKTQKAAVCHGAADLRLVRLSPHPAVRLPTGSRRNEGTVLIPGRQAYSLPWRWRGSDPGRCYWFVRV